MRPASSLLVGERLDGQAVHRLRSLVFFSGLVVLVTACLVLSGYASGILILTTVRPGLRAMSVVTAVGLMLLALATLANLFRRPRLGWAMDGIVVLLGAAMLVSHAIHGDDVISPPLTLWLFGFAPDLAGRTSTATAFGLILVALALASKGRSGARSTILADVLAGTGLLISGMAAISYVYGVQDLYALAPFATMGLHTSLALVLLSLDALLVDPERGWAATVASDYLGGGAARRQLLLTLLIPIAGSLLLWATDAKRIGPNLAMALLVVLTTASLAILILRDARSQNALDAERRARTAILAEAKAEVDAQLQERIAALAIETHERIQAEEALRQSQKLEAIGQLTGGVAHDFNNLLTVIRSSVDLLARPDLPEARRQRYIAAISDTVTRAAKLTGQLLAFARRQALKPEVFAVNGAIEALSEMIGTLVGARIEVVIDVPGTAWHVNVDPNQFDTALVNMVANARDAMKDGGRLVVGIETVQEVPAVRAHAAKRGEFVAVRLTDTGVGIPPELVEQIFEPFFTTKGVGHGTGLGLSQVFGFAKQSGGDVRVESEVGRGSTFLMYLPRVAAQTHAPNVDSEPLIDGHGTSVLVVEDNIDVGTFASQALEELGYETVWTTDAAHALQILAEDHARFDVVFSDVIMPGMNGIELGREIRRLYRDLPVVLTSGYSHVLAQNGTYGFELLHKPYSIEQLSRVLRKMATWQRRQRLMPE